MAGHGKPAKAGEEHNIINDELTQDIEADIEETELMEDLLDWTGDAELHLLAYPGDRKIIENINDLYRFHLSDYEQNALLSRCRLGGRN